MLDAHAAERAHQADLRHRYQMYIDQQADAHLDGMDPVERDRLLNAKAVALRAQYPHATFWKADTLAAIARASARQDLVARLPLMDFKSFVARDPVTHGAALMPRVVDTTAENAGHDQIPEGGASLPQCRSGDGRAGSSTHCEKPGDIHLVGQCATANLKHTGASGPSAYISLQERRELVGNR